MSAISALLSTPQIILAGARQYGPKAVALARQAQFGFNVPNFFAISAQHVREIIEDSFDIDTLAAAFRQHLPAQQYCLRSSALQEDSATSSMAGCFHSMTAVAPENLQSAIHEWLNHEKNKTAVCNSEIAMIVQVNITAEFSGVCFTRDPRGNRHMVLEYVKGPCHALVSGLIQPTKLEVLHTRIAPEIAPAFVNEVLTLGQQVERAEHAPQDIEWCYADKKLWLLQARPISTITKAEYQGMLYIDQQWRPTRATFLKKTALTEATPYPCPCTFSLLNLLFATEGPVQKTYNKYGLTYSPRPHLLIVAAALYENLEESLRSLFPAKRLLQASVSKWSFSSLSALVVSLRNLWVLSRIKIPDTSVLTQKLHEKLNVSLTARADDVTQALSLFLEDFQLVFEINFLAELALKRLLSAVKLLNCEALINPAQLLSEDSSGLRPVITSTKLIGNSLDFLDRTEFLQLHSNTRKPELEEILKDLAPWKRAYLTPLMLLAAKYTTLREETRRLTISRKTRLYCALVELAKKHNFEDPLNVFFLSLEELLEDKIHEEKGQHRKQEREHLLAFSMPLELSSEIYPNTGETDQPLGLSSGLAQGALTTLEMLVDSKLRQSETKCILYTDNLTPDLLQHFPKLSGIISARGGYLSHLAILAREHRLPVVSNCQYRTLGLNPGDLVEIDGLSGKVKRL